MMQNMQEFCYNGWHLDELILNCDGGACELICKKSH